MVSQVKEQHQKLRATDPLILAVTLD